LGEIAIVLKDFWQSKLILSTFVISLLVSLAFIYFSERLHYQQTHLITKNIASNYVSLIKNNLSQAMSATYPLAALIRKQNGSTEGFNGLATEMLNFYPGVASLQLQPEGVISHIIPLQGNEKAIGHNVLADPKRNKEAILARDSGKLTLAGPFSLMQGGAGAAARLPIYLETPQGEFFWGFSAALIRFPDVLESARLPSLVDSGYAYQLSRTHPDPGATHMISASDAPLKEDPELFYIDVPNAQWQFKITPIKGWTALTPLIIKALFGLLFTFLLTFLAVLLSRLKSEHMQLENTVNERTKALESLAHYDVLTRLPNRALFSDRFNQALAQSNRNETMLAVCFLDLDDFKIINDTYGHDEGDKLLVAVAARLKNIIRAGDTVSRQGGDEFILLLNDISSIEQLELSLERVRHAMVKPYLVEGRSHTINLSLGATLYPRDNANLDTLLRHADHAMYQAKLTGKNRYHLFNSLDNDLIAQKHNDLQEIEQALINNEFQLYYQPKVNMKTGDVIGAEALIRWIHPENGLIPPLDFLPIIENTELEVQVGGWVINEAIKQLNTWYKQKIKLDISINISSHHIQSSQFFTQLKTAFSRYPAVKSHRLQLEVLESSALGDINAINNIIKQCQTELDIHVALDDFGTGYSSLTHLRNLPANTIKIDQTFVRDLLDDPNDFSIIDGVISLAEAFDKEIIAEGVETTEHGVILLVMGCDAAQGYGIARPLPADDFALWLQEYEPNKIWLEHGKRSYSRQEQKLILIELTTAYWFQNLTESLQNSKADDETHVKCCHLGAWLNRFEQDSLFDSDWFYSLQTAHDALFDYAEFLYLHSDKPISSKELKTLNKHYTTLKHLIENYQTSSLLAPFRINMGLSS
jgi:diguanylate cyclase (GGDEF)-like protein